MGKDYIQEEEWKIIGERALIVTFWLKIRQRRKKIQEANK